MTGLISFSSPTTQTCGIIDGISVRNARRMSLAVSSHKEKLQRRSGAPLHVFIWFDFGVVSALIVCQPQQSIISPNAAARVCAVDLEVSLRWN